MPRMWSWTYRSSTKPPTATTPAALTSGSCSAYSLQRIGRHSLAYALDHLVVGDPRRSVGSSVIRRILRSIASMSQKRRARRPCTKVTDRAGDRPRGGAVPWLRSAHRALPLDSDLKLTTLPAPHQHQDGDGSPSEQEDNGPPWPSSLPGLRRFSAGSARRFSWLLVAPEGGSTCLRIGCDGHGIGCDGLCIGPRPVPCLIEMLGRHGNLLLSPRSGREASGPHPGRR
jgi:hypothetical protein